MLEESFSPHRPFALLRVTYNCECLYQTQALQPHNVILRKFYSSNDSKLEHYLAVGLQTPFRWNREKLNHTELSLTEVSDILPGAVPSKMLLQHRRVFRIFL